LLRPLGFLGTTELLKGVKSGGRSAPFPVSGRTAEQQIQYLTHASTLNHQQIITDENT